MGAICQQPPVVAPQWLAPVLDAIPLPSAVATRKGRILCVNSSLRQLVDDTFESLTPGQPPEDLLNRLPKLHELIEEVLRTYAGDARHWYDLPLGTGASVPLQARVRMLPPIADEAPLALITFSDLDGTDTRRRFEQDGHKYRELLQISANLVFITDAEGNLTFVNNAWCRQLGYEAAEVVGMSSLALVFPESQRAYREALQEARSGRCVEQIEFRARTKNGDAIDILAYLAPMPDDTGHVMEIIGSGKDITEYKQTQEKLQNSEERLRVLFEYAPDAYYLFDLMGTFLDCNRAMEVLTGYGREELIGESLLKIDLLPRKQLPRAAGCLAKNATGHRVGPVEFSVNRKDGTHARIEIHTYPIQIGGRNVVLGTARDISDRKKAEDALRESEEKFKVIFEEACEGIAYLNDAGCVLDVNKRALEILERSKEEVLGKHFIELGILDLGDITRFLSHFQQVLLGTLQPLELSLTNKRGRKLYLECSASVVRKKGSTRGLVIMIRDVTEGKQAQLRQNQLVQKLSDTNQELQDFAHIVSHDLKAPLRAIKMLADWIAVDYQDKLDAQGKQNLRLLGSRVNHMQSLIDGILRYSRIGHTERPIAPVPLSQLLPEVIANLEVPGHISIEIQPDLPVVPTDVTRITQVFQNLLSNAIKYMDKPEGQIRVTCEDQGDAWKFRVSDNGPGIEEKHFERIFKIFQTLAPKDEYESTGVGLTLVKKIVELYGGKVWVESVVGQGSTFLFTWPKQSPPGATDPNNDPAAEVPAPTVTQS
jgi:two-component system sensor kinase FixL